MNIKATYYKNVILGIHRGNYRGTFSNAKPLFVLALMEVIDKGDIIANRITFSNELKDVFNRISLRYEPAEKPTNLEMPFFHMGRELFYNIKYAEGAKPPLFAHTLSAKFIRENVEYAYLDDQLWDLLQDKEIREEYKQAIIDFYIKRQ